MVRPSPSLLLPVLLLPSLLGAQTFQRFDLHPDATSFTSRGSIPGGAVELLQGVHTSSFRGVLDVRGTARVARLSVVTQDQNCSTRETFDYVVRSGTDATGPDGSTGGLLGEVKGVNLPTSTMSGTCAWTLTTSLTQAAAIPVPTGAHWSYGVRLNIGGAQYWARDGQSIHGTAGDSVANEHRNHSRSEDQAWEVLPPSTVASHPPNKRSWRMSVFVRGGVVMNLRCDGRKGYGGTFPRASTAAAPKAWDARIDGGSDRAGMAAITTLGAVRNQGVRIGGGSRLYVDGPYFIWFGPSTDRDGVAIVPLLPFVPANVAGIGTLYLQGAIGNATGLWLSNSQSITP